MCILFLEAPVDIRTSFRLFLQPEVRRLRCCQRTTTRISNGFVESISVLCLLYMMQVAHSDDAGPNHSADMERQIRVTGRWGANGCWHRRRR